MVAGIAVSSVIAAWGINSVFTLRVIEVSGEGVAVSVDAAKLPKNLLFFPTATLQEQILKDYLLVERVEMKKKYPHTLVITAVPRKPFATVGVGNQAYSVDDSGVVLAQYPTDPALPAVRIATGPLQPGMRISDTRVAAALGFLRESRSIVRISEITLLDSTSLRASANGVSIQFAHDADPAAIARTLQTLLAGFRIKGVLPGVIDLRFDKPVITF